MIPRDDGSIPAGGEGGGGEDDDQAQRLTIIDSATERFSLFLFLFSFFSRFNAG